MDISAVLSEQFTTFDADTPLSKAAGAFEDQSLDAVIVTDDDRYQGVLSRRRLADSSTAGSESVGARARHVPTVGRTEDVREVARLMIASDALTLPVFEDEDLVGVVTGDAVLEAVRDALDVVTVADVYEAEFDSVGPETTVGETLNRLRSGRIDRLPVLDDGDLTGTVSLYDVAGFVNRRVTSSSSGEAGRGRRRGGGREGGSDRALDAPVAELASGDPSTIDRDAPLDEAVGIMLDRGVSSLVVTTDDGRDVVGVVTKPDVLEALTWEEPAESPPFQLSGGELLEEMDATDALSLIERVAGKYGAATVIRASLDLHRHRERSRGLPLVLARVRLVTDRGYFTAAGEGYGGDHAVRVAVNGLERQILKGKTYHRGRRGRDDEASDALYGWWLGG